MGLNVYPKRVGCLDVVLFRLFGKTLTCSQSFILSETSSSPPNCPCFSRLLLTLSRLLLLLVIVARGSPMNRRLETSSFSFFHPPIYNFLTTLSPFNIQTPKHRLRFLDHTLTPPLSTGDCRRTTEPVHTAGCWSPACWKLNARTTEPDR
ncbi:hypothetical protein L6452_30779 [Arctium lappa]|uniref:Uncharacterized protein n=1 Tax=Arctium lappa TaxID=4217 RepID=A0ACB8ZKA3_ARCLA|nr:hypothetical protein L6452_30779 [Arctium lappa]